MALLVEENRFILSQPLKPWTGGNEPPGMGLRRVGVGKPVRVLTPDYSIGFSVNTSTS